MEEDGNDDRSDRFPVKKRILICESTVPFVSGGAELLVQGLARAIGEAGHDVDVLSIPYQWDPPERIVKSCLIWRLLDLQSPAGEVDLVIATKFPTYAIEHPNKVAWVFHQHRSVYDLKDTIYDDLAGRDDADDYRKTISDMDRRFLSECRALFAISENVAKRLRQNCAMESEAVYHPPPLDGRYYSDDYGDDILLVGRLEPLKRVDLAIRAMKYVKRSGAMLRVLGRGFLEEPLKNLAVAEGVTDRVRFDGFVPDEELLGLYSRAGCVVYVPFDEDYGYSPLEAFKSRRPVVVTDDSGGPLEFVADGESGLVVPARPEDLANAIDCLLADRKKARKFGASGFDRVEGITWQAAIDRLVNPHL